MRGRSHGENTTPSSQRIDILRSVFVSRNIEVMMAESAIYRGREMLSKMVDGLELAMITGDDEIEAEGRINQDSGCWHHLRPSMASDFTR